MSGIFGFLRFSSQNTRKLGKMTFIPHHLRKIQCLSQMVIYALLPRSETFLTSNFVLWVIVKKKKNQG